mmetsp:Transcript_23930/g.20949  ORF Transcript_23930/g.20949 Transcript_23930/m.20949 type:complete len:124 (+) Transcript_23930:1383-1754(+)
MLKPYSQLWELVEKFKNYDQQWTKDIIFNLDPELVERETKLMLNTARKMTVQFTKHMVHPHSVAQEILGEVTSFNKHVPLVRCLCNKGLKDNHWKQISELIKMNIDRETKLRLDQLIGIDAHA